MINIVVITRSGQEVGVAAEEGLSLMEALREAGLDELMALCGGNCSCATCHVYIDGSLGDHLPLLSSEEDELLDGTQHRNDLSRLSCQIPCTAELDGMRVTIAPED